jgi:Sulfotransferase family
VLDPIRLLEDAVAATRLSDLGSPTFREGLERFVDSLNGEAALSPLGHAMADGLIRGALANRLRIEAWYAAHPELASERIVSPLFVVGMSRSGTTALSHLLGRDPNLRSLLAWESNDSVPPPEAATYGTDPRLLAANERDAFAEAAMPGFRALHYDPPDAPMECVMLFNHTFDSSAF